MSIETTGPEQARTEEPAPNREILEAVTALAKRVGAAGHSMAAGLGVAPPDLIALFKLDGTMAMKELAQRMGVDASFVTAVADALEKRGFVRREPGQRDRRIKNLVLTPAGIAAKEQLMAQISQRMPWSYALDDEERRVFLGLVKKMLDATPAAADGCDVLAECPAGPAMSGAGASPDEEVGRADRVSAERSE